MLTIPLRNIYFLLAYAWDRVEQAETIGISVDEFSNLADLFASVLARGTRHLLKRGLDRGYREIDEVVPGIRGRLRFNESLRANLFSVGRAYCTYDELTADVIHNQIIAQTLRNLLTLDGLDADLANEVHDCLDRLGRLTPICLTSSLFSRVQLHGNNAFYTFLLSVCRFIHDATFIDARGGHRRFVDFLREDGPLARLFERFVFNFLKREQKTFKVGNRVLKWAQTRGTAEELAYLPAMRTDVYLNSDSRRIVIDAKFYREVVSKHFGRDKARSAHIYQIYSYVRNISLLEPKLPSVEGILLYPMVNMALDLRYEIHGHRISIRTIDLNASWQEIANSLLNLTA